MKSLGFQVNDHRLVNHRKGQTRTSHQRSPAIGSCGWPQLARRGTDPRSPRESRTPGTSIEHHQRRVKPLGSGPYPVQVSRQVGDQQ